MSENEIDENNFESFAYICFTLIRSALYYITYVLKLD